MTNYTTGRMKKPEVSKKHKTAVIVIMLVSIGFGIFAAGCIAGIRAAQIKKKRVNFHQIHEAEYFDQ